MEQATIGPAVDIRGTEEAANRVRALLLSFGTEIPPPIIQMAKIECQ
jgi:hypothetical protein